MMNRCPHGVYMPDVDLPTGKSYSCGLCYPEGHPERVAVPVLPKANNATVGTLETCSECGNLILYSTPGCAACEPRKQQQGREQSLANAKKEGACPHCGSNIHYETEKKRTWLCAECYKEFPAPKSRQ